ncbi:DedA family protein [Streptomyces sp. NBC_00306]|uniref:DedA family protein n=1 Tax=Streptomyces sp. NBC_00306 TaxID=2975708 RepID=UPI002E2D5FE9|nr:hypothetical protein [Streptomyces sp. NBC_00306]
MLSDLTHELIGSPLILAVALLAVFLDALVPVMPSGTLVLAASLWATTQEVGLLAVAVPVAAASVLGDLLVVTLARSRPLRRPALTSAAARMGKALTGRLGRTTVAARFVPGGRTVLAVAVGTTGVSRRRHLFWSVVGGVLWAGYLTGLGRLNSLWFDASWLGFAVSVAATVVMGACLARALSVGKHPARRSAQVQLSGGPLRSGLSDTDLSGLGHRTHPLKPQRLRTRRTVEEKIPPVTGAYTWWTSNLWRVRRLCRMLSPSVRPLLPPELIAQPPAGPSHCPACGI